LSEEQIAVIERTGYGANGYKAKASQKCGALIYVQAGYYSHKSEKYSKI
jgi:hypothetical protein